MTHSKFFCNTLGRSTKKGRVFDEAEDHLGGSQRFERFQTGSYALIDKISLQAAFSQCEIGHRCRLYVLSEANNPKGYI